jgi:hypothetical protein
MSKKQQNLLLDSCRKLSPREQLLRCTGIAAAGTWSTAAQPPRTHAHAAAWQLPANHPEAAAINNPAAKWPTQ